MTALATALRGAGAPISWVDDSGGKVHARLREARLGPQQIAVYAASSGNPRRLGDALGFIGRLPPDQVRLIACTLHMDGVTDIFVQNADRLPGLDRARYFELAHLSDAHVWLLDAEPGSRPALALQLRQWDCKKVGPEPVLERIVDCLAAPADTPQGADELPPVATLPDTDFLLFAAQCKRINPIPASGRVLRVYWDAFDKATDWLDADAREPKDIVEYLWQTLSAAPSPAAALIASRALQAAALCAGTLLRFSTRDLLNDLPQRTAANDPRTAKRLRSLADPGTAMAAVVALVANVDAAQIAAMELSDLTDDGTAFTVAGQVHECPTELAPLMAMGKVLRRMDPERGNGLCGREPHRGPGDDDAPTRPLVVTQRLNRASRRTDLPLPTRAGQRGATKAWQNRLKLSALPLRAGDPS